MDTIADLLHRARQGERGAFDTLFAQLYPTLRRLAHARLSGHQRPGMMGTTTLLHDSYLRLLGAGALPPTVPEISAPALDLSLRESALRQDWAAWAQAWQQLDATRVDALLGALERGEPVRLTLCGERAWQAFDAAPQGFFQRISGIFGTKPASMRLEQL